MMLQLLRTGLTRDLIAGFVLALVMLGGIVQARAATEKAAGLGFAGTFELCLQSADGAGLGAPHSEHCDDCRATGSLAALPGIQRGAVVSARLIARLAPENDPDHHLIRLITPVSRGPPV